MISIKRIINRITRKKADFNWGLDGNWFVTRLMDFKIFTHDKACVQRTYEQIFNTEVYYFETNSKKPFIIDCGANVGLSVLYFKSILPDADIVAIEPSKEAFRSLIKNVEANNLKDITCINKAASDKVGTVNFSTNEIISGSIRSEKVMELSYEVETFPLSDLMDRRVDLLKIDIEGAEKMVFPEIENFLSNVDHLFLEFHSFIPEKQYLSSILLSLEKNGFRYFIENDLKDNLSKPFINQKQSLNQDLQLNIWAKRVESTK